MLDPYETIRSLEARQESTMADCERIIVAVEKLTAVLGIQKTWDECYATPVEILIVQLDAATERVRQILSGPEAEVRRVLGDQSVRIECGPDGPKRFRGDKELKMGEE